MAVGAAVPEGLEDYLWQWAGVLRTSVDQVALRRIAAALDGAPLALFDDACRRRARDIEGKAKGLLYLVPIAAGVGKLAGRLRAEQETRRQASAAERDREHSEWLASMTRTMAREWLDVAASTAEDREVLLARFPDLESG